MMPCFWSCTKCIFFPCSKSKWDSMRSVWCRVTIVISGTYTYSFLFSARHGLTYDCPYFYNVYVCYCTARGPVANSSGSGGDGGTIISSEEHTQLLHKMTEFQTERAELNEKVRYLERKVQIFLFHLNDEWYLSISRAKEADSVSPSLTRAHTSFSSLCFISDVCFVFLFHA